MIIRSQDKKKLHNLDGIKMISVTTNSQNYFVEVNSQKTIGTYSTEEKAIKVLDMIQSAYCRTEDVKSGAVQAQKQDSFCFDMPQDSEVVK